MEILRELEAPKRGGGGVCRGENQVKCFHIFPSFILLDTGKPLQEEAEMSDEHICIKSFTISNLSVFCHLTPFLSLLFWDFVLAR